MSPRDSGPYERSGAGGGDAAGRPPRSQAPLVQLLSVPLVQDEAGGRTPRIQLGHVADRIAKRFGLDPVTLEGPCPLPGHEGRARLVSGVPEDERDDLRLACSCQGRWRSLGEVRAAIGYGIDNGGLPRRKGGRSNIELAIWTRLLAYEAGAFQPAPVAVPQLASAASPAVERVLEGFRLLVGLRWADGPHLPVPFSVRFAVAWCDVSHGAAHEAIRALIREGIICEVERHGRLSLYLPGPVPEEAEPQRDHADEDALIARIIEAFDAEELPPDEEARP